VINIFKEKSTVIFDFDGTIADTFHLHKKAFEQAFADYNVNFDYNDFKGMSTKEAVGLILSANHIQADTLQIDKLVKDKRILANQFYKNSITFINGAQSFIELLYRNGFQLFIGSSGSRMNVNTGLETLGIRQYFKDVITSDDVKKSKPDPEIFQKIVLQYNIKPVNAIVIEDAEAGIRAAQAADIDVVCIDNIILDGETKGLIQMDFFQLINELDEAVRK
jgi:beta-phosphoglucomutase